MYESSTCFAICAVVLFLFLAFGTTDCPPAEAAALDTTVPALLYLPAGQKKKKKKIKNKEEEEEEEEEEEGKKREKEEKMI